MNIPPVRATKAQQGVVLLEALIAILIFSLGVLGLVGLQATMIKSTSDAKFRSEASFIAQQKIGQIWADPTAEHGSPPVPIASLPNGTREVTKRFVGPVPPLERSLEFTVVVTWQQPGEPEHNFTTIASISGD